MHQRLEAVVATQGERLVPEQVDARVVGGEAARGGLQPLAGAEPTATATNNAPRTNTTPPPTKDARPKKTNTNPTSG